MAKLLKVECYVIVYDSKLDLDFFEENLRWQFEDICGAFRYEHNGEPYLKLMRSKIQTADVGEWYDEHKFNLVSTPLEEYEKEFEDWYIKVNIKLAGS